MISFIAALLLLAVSMATVVIRKTYYYLPLRELKRQAAAGDSVSVKLYAAVAYGSSLRVLLWLILGLSSAGGFVLLARIAPLWMSFVAVVLLIWVVYSWLPASRVSTIGIHLATLVTPGIVRLLGWLHPVLSRSAAQIDKRRPGSPHTQIYEREDLLELIERQAGQEDSRITPEELTVVQRTLTFDEHTVHDILTSRKLLKTISLDDTVGPVLIDELHQSGQPFVLVTGDHKDDIVGILQVSKLGLTTSGHVRDYMQQPVYFLNEHDTLATALHAFYTTNHNIFVVINNSEEYLGIATVQNLLEQLLGRAPDADFPEYADRAAVAYRHTDAARAEKAEAIAAQLADGKDIVEQEMLPQTDETVVE